MHQRGGLRASMSKRLGLFAPIRARLHDDERGFSLLETVIAIGVIFASLLVLANAATSGFAYQNLARQKQAANGIANQLMEQVRGLTYERISSGLSSTDLSGDPNIVDCSGMLRFLSCSPGSEPGSGEKIVSSPGLSDVAPLVPHRSTSAPNTSPVVNATTYEWSTYVTQDDAVADTPYRVTVIVSWTSSGGAPNKLVRLQSLFWSPTGCSSDETHPFGGPCQSYFFGQATAPTGTISFTGSLQGLSFTSGNLSLTAATSGAQQEQISEAEGSFTSPRAQVTDGGGTRTTGGVVGATLADGDPGTDTVGTYSRQRCPTEVTCSGGTVTSPSAGGTTQIAFTAPAGTTAESDSALAADVTSVCPPPPDTAETDEDPCAGTAITQSGTVSAIATLNGTDPAVGTATLAQALAPSSPTKSFVDRVRNPDTGLCSPGADEEGCVAATATKSVGTLNLGGLPSAMTAPAGWSGANPWNGFYLSIVNYAGQSTAAAGTSSPLPSASFTSGSLYYWDGAGYTGPISLTSSSLNGLNVSYSRTQRIDGTNVTVSLSTVSSTMAAGSTSTTADPSTSGTLTRTTASAQVVAPVVSVQYRVTIPGRTFIDVTITVQLGTIQATATYAAAPAEA